jgi:hypothetical protein
MRCHVGRLYEYYANLEVRTALSEAQISESYHQGRCELLGTVIETLTKQVERAKLNSVRDKAGQAYATKALGRDINRWFNAQGLGETGDEVVPCDNSGSGNSYE